MRIQNFTKSPFQAKYAATRPFTAHGCDSFTTYKAANPGQFIDPPATHEPCAPGFRFYQQANGVIVALNLD